MTDMTLSRRGFLAGSAGLVLAVTLPVKGRAQAGQPTAPNAFVRVAPDNTVTVMVKHIEIGQGANTGLPVIVADEMDADWSQIRAESAPANPVYKNLVFGVQGTGGSLGLANSWTQMRQAGAAARAMLVAAAAENWGVTPQGITVSKGVVSHSESGRSATFGELADDAAKQPVPVDVPLKDPADFTLIGGEGVIRTDSAAKSRGEAQFTIDVYRDGMEVVAMVHPPQFGATVSSFDDSAAMEVPGVTAVRELPSGIAVYAKNTYAALRGRAAVTAEWDTSKAETRSSEEMERAWLEAARNPASPKTVEETGDVEQAFSDAAQVVEAEYVFPYLAHAALEPEDGVIEVRGDGAEVWMGSQFQGADHPTIAGILGMAPENVKFNTMFAGGSFGRRATQASYTAQELANVAKAAGGEGAWKLMWTRENDIRGGRYRPLTVHTLRAGLDGEGNVTAWDNVVANQSIMIGTPFEKMTVKDGIDPTSFEGSNELPYGVAAARLRWQQMESPVPILWWRSVGHTHTGYAVETFMDTVLAAAGKDPVEGRLAMMKDERPRDRAVLERVAEMADWSGPGTGDRRKGVAVVRSFDSYVAQIAEVEDRGGVPKVTRVWCAVDCGVAVTPDVIRAQMEGGIGMGLGTALYSEITLGENGRVRQSNYDGYRVPRISDMPEIEVSIIKSTADPTGVGEPGLPPSAPAMANAWRSLTGTLPTRLPFAVATS